MCVIHKQKESLHVYIEYALIENGMVRWCPLRGHYNGQFVVCDVCLRACVTMEG